MATNLAPVLKQRYFDANGNPLAGGLLYTYQAGTTTPQATYTDSSGVTPNSNPVVLDANGEANVWLDISLSYKFILEDASGANQWTTDNVIGLITNNTVSTAAIQDGAVTTPKLANNAVTSAKLLSDPSIDANRAVTTDHIRDNAINTAKILDGLLTRPKLNSLTLLNPHIQKFTSGSGTYGSSYYFYIASANATLGATYTNNGFTFTVVNTISGASLLLATGTGVPESAGTLTKASGTGDATIAFTAVSAPKYLRVKMVGGGGGGASSGGAAGGSGGTSTFGTSLLTATGGGGGSGTNSVIPSGGTVTINSPAIEVVAVVGGQGTARASQINYGGAGGNSFFGGAGGSKNGTGGVAATNSGSGGGGADNGPSAGGGSGGSAGGYLEAIISTPSATYSYAVGAAGSGGGAAGGSGIIIVEEYFQ